MRKGFDVYEIMVEESVKDSENQEENQETEKAENPGTPMNTIRPKVEEALRIANEPIVKNRMPDLAASFDSLKEIIGNIEERKAEVAAVDDEDMISAGEAWIHTEEIHLSWYEAQIEFAETGKESTKQ